MRAREQQRAVSHNRRTRGNGNPWMNECGYLNTTEFLALSNIEREERAKKVAASIRYAQMRTRVMRY